MRQALTTVIAGGRPKRSVHGSEGRSSGCSRTVVTLTPSRQAGTPPPCGHGGRPGRGLGPGAHDLGHLIVHVDDGTRVV